MQPELAATIGLRALAYIASDDDGLASLLAQSGLTADDLRARSADPALLGGVLDFLLADERRLLAFCAHAGLEATLPQKARHALPGGCPID